MFTNSKVILSHRAQGSYIKYSILYVLYFVCYRGTAADSPSTGYALRTAGVKMDVKGEPVVESRRIGRPEPLCGFVRVPVGRRKSTQPQQRSVTFPCVSTSVPWHSEYLGHFHGRSHQFNLYCIKFIVELCIMFLSSSLENYH